MGDRPTFSITDDYVALMDLKPAERTVYMLLRSNAAFGRRGVATHTVHVTAAWFTEMTAHWEKPFAASSARRGINGLIDKGVLIRLNPPQDGSGFVLAFVSDPRGHLDGPVNGFEHAKRVSKRCGVKVYYQRKDELPGMPSVTGVRLGSRSVPKEMQDSWTDSGHDDTPAEEPRPEPTPAAEKPALPKPRTESELEPEQAHLTPEAAEFAEHLEERTGRFTDPKLRLMTGACQRLAEAAQSALDRGWEPKVLANRLASELNPRINSPERFLFSKLKDTGNPPKKTQTETAPTGDLQLDGIREADMRRTPAPEEAPERDDDVADDAERERLRKLYRERMARRKLSGGSAFPRKS